jgi:hypothetical protein
VYVDDGQLVLYENADRPDAQFSAGYDLATGAELWRRRASLDEAALAAHGMVMARRTELLMGGTGNLR